MGIISDLVANLNTTNEQPLRQLLATYYQELLEQRTGSVLGVFDRMNLDISNVCGSNKSNYHQKMSN
ncbi:bacteriocin immunity protein [Lactiplantibacillus argentoratensis]|uniref:bacteriocin immunity protein n=1 Tax=Lactiplantibacillus argentoratensis TaxID=271881 RepID=UPI001CE02B3B|nr:bacteriocin immunity protein [Lactiplantibacillus argentoratensis]MCA5598082.1 bacteriocin immunity protein [Lactiplantibacillus argentoratensis]